MASSTDPDSKEKVNDFLLRVQELGERDKSDEERSKRLEEEILQSRRERQARRAERARSISPTKDSPPIRFDPARFSMSSIGQRAINPPEQLSPTPRTPEREVSPRPDPTTQDDHHSSFTPGSRRGSRMEGNENDGESSPKPASPSLLGRRGTLSWQQRPSSRDLSGNRTFFSSSPTRTNRLRGLSTASNNDPGMSPNSVASSPTKEVPWLRQKEQTTPSPTREENLEEEHLEPSSSVTSSKEVELDQEKTPEPPKETRRQEVPDERSRSPSRASSTFADSSFGNRYSSVSSVSTATGLGSPVPTSGAQKFEPPKTESEDPFGGPPSPRRRSPERSNSPTKGLGGFVQSAMMKRSDSVSKRWSAQLPSGLSRGNSVSSNRNSFAAPSNTGGLTSPPAPKLGRESSYLSSHRPGSSHSEATVVHPTKDSNDRPATPTTSGENIQSRNDDSPMRPPLSLHARSNSSFNNDRPATPPTGGTINPRNDDSPMRPPLSLHARSNSSFNHDRPATPPTSGSHTNPRNDDSPKRPPLSLHARSSSSVNNDMASESGSLPSSSPAASRTMDPKRWSPTKSTWLESALNRPDTPRHRKQPSQQPTWAANRQSRGSVDMGRVNSFKEVTPVGLMRTAAPGSHSKSSSISGIPDVFGIANETAKAKEEAAGAPLPPKSKEESTSSSLEKNPEPIVEEPPATSADQGQEQKPETIPETQGLESKGLETKSLDIKSPDIKSPEIKSPETTSPETKSPETKSPEITSPETKSPETKSPEIKSPEIKSPEIKSPEIKSPETETKSPDSEMPKTEAPEVTPTESKPETTKPEVPKDNTRTHKRAPSALDTAPKTSLDLPLPSPRDPPRDPLLNRPKPQAPVIDFRANLRKREVVKDQGPKQEPEFKNVFGKLKRTETQNYVAPDELKDNILRGKAALNVTGGPKKTERVDEFKESLVKQKEAMKLSGGSIRRNTAGEKDAPVKESSTKEVPEAIARRQNLSKSTSAQSNLSTNAPSSSLGEPEEPQKSPDAPILPDEQIEGSQSPELTKSSTDEIREPVTEPKSLEIEKIETTTSDVKPRGDDLDLEDKENKGSKANEETITPVRVLSSENVVQAAEVPAPTELPPAKGKLAGRINPALAGLLSRGPPAPTSGSKGLSATNATENNATGSPSSQAGAPLTHATKSRARGPKRRLPGTVAPQVTPAPDEDETTSKEIPFSFDLPKPAASPPPAEDFAANSSNWPLPDGDIATPAAPEVAPAQPAEPNNKPTEFQRSLPRVTERIPEPEYQETRSKPSVDLDRPSPFSNRRTYGDVEHSKDSPFSRSSFTSRPPPSPSTPTISQTRSPQTHFSSPSPSPLRTSFRENQAAPTTPSKTRIGLAPRSREVSREKALPSPPVPPKRSESDKLSSPRSSGSLVPQADESLEAISGFFKTFPRSSDRVNIDPQLMLMGRHESEKTRTLKKQIWEITGDGKRQDLPAAQEYILYEGSMYLCVHMFERESLTQTQVQLWCGDAVSESAIDDAQSFSKKVAKENGTKLQVIKQGKETAHFIQALGGILITRRGFNSRSSSSAFFMLCGRKHLGQMVFDEVDFNRKSLCSGFPFVISAMFGKLYLWKGRGSAPEEIGAARLIGMDLGLTGEFEEVAEGEEPESFFESFPLSDDAGDYLRSDYWKLKPNHDHFQTRLFRVDHELGQRSGFWIRRSGSNSPVIRPNDTVQEVEPFCEKDLSTKGIYVLDTFFEIYVIVGEQASNRPAEFASAVVFAHEYGILAASLQDRPFIPKSFVSLGGLPDSCISALRKHEQRLSPRAPPQVFPLNAAIEAIRST